MLFALSLFGILRLHGERLKNGIVNCDKLHYLIVKTFSVRKNMLCINGLYTGGLWCVKRN